MRKLFSLLALSLCIFISACDGSEEPVTYRVQFKANKAPLGTTTFTSIRYNSGTGEQVLSNSTANFDQSFTITPNTYFSLAVQGTVNAASLPSSSVTIQKLQGDTVVDGSVCEYSQLSASGSGSNYTFGHYYYYQFTGTGCVPDNRATKK
jgi:hypothetical protein